MCLQTPAYMHTRTHSLCAEAEVQKLTAAHHLPPPARTVYIPVAACWVFSTTARRTAAGLSTGLDRPAVWMCGPAQGASPGTYMVVVEGPVRPGAWTWNQALGLRGPHPQSELSLA